MLSPEDLLKPRYKVIADKGNDKYSVCDQGFIINNKTGRILKTYINKKKKGYVYVKLQEGCVQRSCHVGNLVGIYFVPNPLNKPTINHDDGNKLNNHYKNLSWLTHQEQTNHAWSTGLAVKIFGRKRLKKAI